MKIVNNFTQLFDTLGELVTVFIGICMIFMIAKSFYSSSAKAMGPVVFRFCIAAIIVNSVPEMIQIATGTGDSLAGPIQTVIKGVADSVASAFK